MKYLIYILLLLIPLRAFSTEDTVYVNNQNAILLEGAQIHSFTDYTGKLPFKKIKTLSSAFNRSRSLVPDYGVSTEVFWIRFTLFNKTNQQHLLVYLKNPNLNHVRIYYPVDGKKDYAYRNGGNLSPLSTHKYKNQSDVFEVPISPGSARTIYLRIQSIGRIMVPVMVGGQESIIESIYHDKLIFGIYLGIILIMLFYNLFIYFTVKDKLYLYYIIFLFFICFALICLRGYGYRYIWNAAPYITLQSINWAEILSGISIIIFLREFLYTRKNLPFFDKIMSAFIVLYILMIPLSLLGLYNVSFIMIDFIALIACIGFLGAGIKLTIDKFPSAKFFLIAWSALIISIIISILKDFNIIPYNYITSNILLIGSVIEIAFLSFALADKINIYKIEKDYAQARALKVSQEKELYVRRENVVLEAKVAERTSKLERANTKLSGAIANLKTAQSQLIHAEKMASIGQLTAGIAHEINNPINFVKSNVKSLRLDINDLLALLQLYSGITTKNVETKQEEIRIFIEEIDLNTVKEEIEELLSGIQEGANRTAEIVRGLRTFSRVDENVFKKTDLHAGLGATLKLISNITPENLAIIKDYGNIPEVECYPGKINQVFMNLLTNSLQAISSKPKDKNTKENIIIRTRSDNEKIIIRISDTGPGIPEDIIKHIFDPFYTTKEVGEGTGLGLSIAYSIIQSHNGTIEVASEIGEGANFIITLPINQKN